MQYRSIPALAAALLSLVLAGPASAALISADLDTALWSDIERGSNLEFLDQDLVTGAEQLRWGGTVPTAEKSGYGFTAGGTSAVALGADQVVLGTFNHLNQVIARGTSIRRATLDLGLTLTISGLGPIDIPLSLRLRHRETTNDCDSSPTCANDEVRIEALTSTHPLLMNVGFLIGNTVSDLFSTVENSNNQALLVATVNVESTAVPEPGTWMLLGIGMVGLVLVRQRALPIPRIDANGNEDAVS